MENITAHMPSAGTTGALAASTGIFGMLLSSLGVSSDLKSLTSFFLIFSFIWQHVGHNFSNMSSSISSMLYSSLTIRQDDWEVYIQFMDWMQDQPFAKTSRNLSVGMQPDRWSYYDEDGGEQDPRDREYCFTPRPGWHLFWFHARPVLFIRRVDQQRDMYGLTNENFELYSLGRNPELLKQLLEDVRQQHLQKDAEKTVVYRDGGVLGKGDGWKRCYSRHSRPLSTVVLDEGQKDAFVRDVKDYLLPSTARWYAQRGIPYRRGYIFYGPPGTGKSSLSFAIAGLFKLKIYVINLASASLTEDHLCSLFSSLPRQCIVLLEDIDAAFVDRNATPAATPPAKSRIPVLPGMGKKAAEEKTETPAKTGVSFSGLLNALDGVASQEGRILIMTTNHIEKLDPALIRPGRVDMKIEFQLASSDVLVSLFERMFEVFPEESPNSDIPLDPKDAEKVLKGLSAQFSESVPANCFSPAEIQGFLLKYKRRPRDAVRDVATWVSEEIKKREEKKREAEKEKTDAESDKKSEKTKRKGLGWTKSLKKSVGSRGSSTKGDEEVKSKS